MNKEARIENWRRTITEQEASGMTPRAFCLNNQINPSRFYYWRRRLRRENVNGFLQLFPAMNSREAGSDTGIRICLYPSLCIELAKGFDPSALRSVVDTLTARD
jgi:hypothetical protein